MDKQNFEYKHTPSDHLFDHDVRITRAISNMIQDGDIEFHLKFTNGTRVYVRRDVRGIGAMSVLASGVNASVVYSFGELRDYLIYLSDRPMDFHEIREFSLRLLGKYPHERESSFPHSQRVIDARKFFLDLNGNSPPKTSACWVNNRTALMGLGIYKSPSPQFAGRVEISVRIFDLDFCTPEAILLARIAAASEKSE